MMDGALHLILPALSNVIGVKQEIGHLQGLYTFARGGDAQALDPRQHAVPRHIPAGC